MKLVALFILGAILSESPRDVCEDQCERSWRYCQEKGPLCYEQKKSCMLTCKAFPKEKP